MIVNRTYIAALQKDGYVIVPTPRVAGVLALAREMKIYDRLLPGTPVFNDRGVCVGKWISFDLDKA